MGLSTSLCNWILDFLSERPQSARIGDNISSTIRLSTGAPQGYVLSPLLFTLLTHNCTILPSPNQIIKFADNTTVVGLNSSNDESAYRDEVQQLAFWCSENNLSLNVDKTKEMIADFRKIRSSHTLSIQGSTVETVNSIKFLGVHISDDLTWTTNTTSITKKAQQRLHSLRRLKQANLPPPILTMFYRGTTESVLTSCIPTGFGNCKVGDLSQLHRIVKAAAKIIGTSLPVLQDIFHRRCISKASCIRLDPHMDSFLSFHPADAIAALGPDPLDCETAFSCKSSDS